MQRPKDCVLVIFGASGDLTARKLVPALFNLHLRGLLPERFAVIGTGRTELTDDTFRERASTGLDADVDAEKRKAFLERLFYQVVDTSCREDYEALRERMRDVSAERSCGGNAVFYLSTPPSLFPPITQHLGACGMTTVDAAWRRVIVEKPLGYDLESARELNEALHAVFDEEQVYRIDHYLGKETVQNMMVFRFGNGLYEPLWNRNYIDRVEVTAAESLGVGKRGGYYDSSGALRDMFQNHLMQIVGMLAMEPPPRFDASSVRNETMKVFESLRALAVDDVRQHVVRGQYLPSTVRGEKLSGYRDEKDVPADSRTETYAAVRFFIDNWRWSGVPFTVRTGKRLPTRVTEAVIHFRHAPHKLFGEEAAVGGNQLVLRVQPDEGILVKFNMKVPGSGFEMREVNMDFHYSDLSDVYVPEAYERLLLDCMLGDATLFARSDAVEACWKFVAPILEAWADPTTPIYGYPSGTWGPKEAQQLIAGGMDWRYPCKNLTDDGEFCEL